MASTRTDAPISPGSIVEKLEAWLDVRDHLDYSVFADIFTSPASLRTVLQHFSAHSSMKPPFGAKATDLVPGSLSVDVRPEQEQADSIWHSLLWKWLLMPRGLTILRDDVVVFGMNKAFDFSAASLHRSEAGGRVLRALAAAPPGGPPPLLVHLVKKRNGEMARVFRDAPTGRWLFAQKNRSVLVAGRAELAALAAAAASAAGDASAAAAAQHAIEVRGQGRRQAASPSVLMPLEVGALLSPRMPLSGRAEAWAPQVATPLPPPSPPSQVGEAWFALLDALGPAAEAALEGFCAGHVLALEKVGAWCGDPCCYCFDCRFDSCRHYCCCCCRCVQGAASSSTWRGRRTPTQPPPSPSSQSTPSTWPGR